MVSFLKYKVTKKYLEQAMNLFKFHGYTAESKLGEGSYGIVYKLRCDTDPKKE